MDTLYIKVAGVTHGKRQSHLAMRRGDEPIRIEPEPENPYDANALAVKCAMASGVEHLGYVPRDLASRVAPLMEGESLMVEIDEIIGGFELADGSLANLGLVLRVELPSDNNDWSDGYGADKAYHDHNDIPF